MAKHLSNERRGPFVELGALHKLLDILKPDDSECTSAWYSSSEPCCKEIILRFRNLLNKWASNEKRVQDCLATDCTLTKCVHCGVIKSIELESQIQENIVERKEDREVTIAEREHDSKFKSPATKSTVKNTRKQEIMKNSHPLVVPRHHRSDVSNHLGKNKTINRSIEKNTIGTSPVIFDKVIEKKSSKFKGIGAKEYLPLMGTVKYLVRGNFDGKDCNGFQDLPDYSITKNQTYFRKMPNHRKHSFALHGSRDVDLSNENPGFIVCDRSRLVEGEMKNESRVAREEIDKKIDNSNITESLGSFSQPNSDSIDNVPLHGSDTSAFSSSSAENLIRQWIKPGWNLRHVNIERKGLSGGTKDLSFGIRATAIPITKNIRNIKTRIAKNDSCDQHEFCKKKNSPKPSNNLTKIQTSRNFDAVDSPDIKSIETSNDHELPGISRAMSSTMWDEKRISEFSEPLALTSKTTQKSLISSITVMSSRNCKHDDLTSETRERFQREILYDEISSREAICENAITTAASKVQQVLLIYRKILESNEEMDWESFEDLVSALHPRHRELWCDICKAVSNEAKRLAEETGATTEVSIEINPLPRKAKKRNVRCHGDEISFELDMTLKDIDIIVENNYSEVSNEFTKISKFRQD